MDVGDLWGRHLLNQATQEARTLLVGERLKAQLAVETNRLLRPFYDVVVEEVAVTGSDLFLAEGSDVTLLFRIKQPELFKARMDGFLANAEKARSNVRRSSGEYLGIPYVQLTTPDRSVHVFSAYPRPELHVRSNSLVALQRVLEAIQGKTPNGGPVQRLGETKEFAYIRTLLPEGAKEEDGLVYLSDPFIRRLMGPEVKLTERRRMLCYNHLRMIGHAALLFRTEHGRSPESLEELRRTQCAPGLFGEGYLSCPDGGKYRLAADGLSGICDHHHQVHNLTPGCEIPVTDVNGIEANEYKAFLREYNQYWRTFFDPIALRIQLTPERYRLETIVLPLIDNSIYTGLASVLGGPPEALDHLPVTRRNIFSTAIKLNKEALLVQSGLAELPSGEGKPGAGTGKRVRTDAEIRCTQNLRELGLAMHMYHDANGRFPAVANFSKEGKPLLSWRVHLLPFLGEQSLYSEFHQDEPWDSPHNQKLIARMPAVYGCPNLKDSEDGKTTYLAPVAGTNRAQQTMFTGDSQGMGMAQILDGTSNTIMLIDAADDRAVVWTRPEDLRFDPKKPHDGLIGHHFGALGTLFADGSVHFLPETLDPSTLQHLFIRNDGHVVAVPEDVYLERAAVRVKLLDLPLDIERLRLKEFLSKGIGDQIGLHVYDSVPLFDFNLPGFLGMALGSFNGRSGIGAPASEGALIGVLVTALNAPTCISIPVRDARIVDDFLSRLDQELIRWSHESRNNNFLPTRQEIYRLELDKRRRVHSGVLQFGPLKWRFFWARIGQGLHIASKEFILEDLLAMDSAGSNGTASKQGASDPGPPAHALVRVRPRHWNQVLPDYRLAWAENNREACLNNLGPLSSLARAFISRDSGERSHSPEERGQEIHRQADRLLGAHLFCPEGGHFKLAPDQKSITCSIHGSALDPRQPPAPSEQSPSSRMNRDFGQLTVTMTFLEDGLHAVMTIDRK